MFESSDSVQVGVQQSPWKKPKSISLSKTKSLKRKSEIFAQPLISNNNSSSFDINTAPIIEFTSNNDNCEPASKSRKTFLNKFSKIKNDSTDQQLNNDNSERNDLYSFFNGSAIPNVAETTSNQEEKVISKQKINETLASLSSSSVVSNFYSDNDSVKVKPKEEEIKTYAFEKTNLLPCDWSLKTRLRFLSTKPFSCNNGIKSSHESEAISNYSKFTSFYNSIDYCKTNSSHSNKDIFKTLLCEAVNYWTFPYLPWLNLYPRNSGLSNLSSMHEPLNAEIQKSLSKSWNQSFKSLYNSLKTNECPYFYVLTHSYVVLFRAQNIGSGVNEMQAILTPSTKGLRQTLKDINFEMPLMPVNSRKSLDNANSENLLNDSNEIQNNSLELNNIESNTNNTNEANISTASTIITTTTNTTNATANSKNKDKQSNDEDEDENDEEDSDEPDEWLEQIGLNSAVNFKSSVLQRNSKNAQKEQILAFDNRPKSTLLFSQGSDVQALFNFLLNSKSCVSNSGPLTGIPPTLISPTCFIGANLQKIKVEQNIIKSLTSTGQSLTQYALDFLGPIMPYHIHRLCNLFKLTQIDDFEMVANIYDQTGSLNCVKKKDENKSELANNLDSNNRVSLFLDESERKSLENSYGIFGESQAIKTISFKNDTFSCNY